jgi:hypothetical protein
MALNIKNEETVALVRQLAAELGTSMTSAVHDAVAARLERARMEGAGEDPVLEKMRWISRDVAARVRASGGGPLTTDDLYDEHGLPA